MGKHFSKKKGGMPSFGNRGDAGRGQRVHSLLPRSRNTLDPRVPEFVLPPPPSPREVIVDIGSDPPQRSLDPSVSDFVMPRSLDPSVPDFVMPPPPPAQVTTTTTYQMGAPVLDTRASEYVPSSQIRLPPDDSEYYPPRRSDLYKNMEFSNSATNIPGLPPARNTGNSVVDSVVGYLGLGGKKRKYTTRRRRRQKKRHQSRKTRRNRK